MKKNKLIISIIFIAAAGMFVLLMLKTRKPVTPFQSGVDYLKKGNYDRAVSSFSDEIEKNNKDSRYFINRAAAYYSMGNYDEAIRDYTRAIELDPRDISSYNNRALAYNNKGLYDLAIRDYTTVIEKNPGVPVAYFGRGMSYKMKGLKDRAMADFKKADVLGHPGAKKIIREPVDK